MNGEGGMRHVPLGRWCNRPPHLTVMTLAESFQHILDGVSDAIIGIDSAWRVTYANAAAVELIGDHPGAGTPLQQVLPAGTAQNIRSSAAERLTKRRSPPRSSEICSSDIAICRITDGSAWNHDVRMYPLDGGFALHLRLVSPVNGLDDVHGNQTRVEKGVTAELPGADSVVVGSASRMGLEAELRREDGRHPDELKEAADGQDVQGDGQANGTGDAYQTVHTSGSIVSDQNFRTLADATPQIVWTIGLDGSVRYLNEQGRIYFGRDDSHPAFEWGSVIHDDDRTTVREKWRDAIEKGTAFESEIRLSRHDGTFRWHLCRALPVIGDDGSIQHWCGTSTDIHELKRAQRILEEREERFRTMADTAPVMIWVADETRACTYFNKGWLDFTGRSLEEESGLGWADRVHPDDREKCLETFDGAFDRREPFSMEFRLLRKDGEYRWILDHGTPLLDSTGTFSGYIGSSIDIHERRHLEDRIRFLAETGPILNSTLDYESTLQAVARLMVPDMADWTAVDMLTSQGALELVAIAHVDPEKVKFGRRLRERYPVDMDAPYGVGHVIRTGQAELYAEITDEMLQQSGRDDEYLDVIRSVGFRSALIVPLSTRGHTIGAITLVRSESDGRYTESDLEFFEELGRRAATVVDNARLFMEVGGARTELQRLNETLEARVAERTEALRSVNETLLDEIDERRRAELETSRLNRLLKLRNRELQDFAHVASHDLQEPLRKILSFSSLLIEEHGSEMDAGRIYLERIEHAADRMMSLIRDLLEFSRVETKGDAFEVVKLRKIIDDVIADLDLRIAETGGRVHIESTCTLEADPVQMRQLLQNLIGNALKFQREGQAPIVQVRARREGVVCVLEVEDNGIGFNEAYLERIFSPFQRLHERSAYPGTGMGLAICRRIVERHEGTITARSTPGRGSTFIVKLPLEQPRHP